jgi:hypothetical protein
MLRVAYWLRGSVTTQDIANRALHAMPMPFTGPIVIPNELDSHALGMRTCDEFFSDETVSTPNSRSGYSTIPVPNDTGIVATATSDEEPNAAVLPVGHSYAQ